MREVTHRIAHIKDETREESKVKEGQADTARQTNTAGDQTGSVRSMVVIRVTMAIAPG